MFVRSLIAIMLPYLMNLLALASFLLLLLDQISKKIIISQSLAHQKNPSLFVFNIPIPLLIIISSIIIISLTIWLKKALTQKNRFLSLGLTLILIGGLSNLYDRLTLSYVIDWIFLPFFPFSVLNLADIYITLGTLLTLLPHPQTKGTSLTRDI